MTALFDPMIAPFDRYGDNGRAVVMIHGFTGVPAHFRPLADHLGESGFTTIAPLLAGHGTNPVDMKTTGRDEWVESVTNAVDAAREDHDEVHLVGLSMGGLLSIIVGFERNADSVTTINSPIIFRNKRIFLARALHAFHPRVSWPEQDPPDLDADVRDYWLTYGWYPTVAAAELLDVSREARVTATKLSCPTLVIQSLVDESVDPRSGAILAESFGSQSKLVWLKRSIHNSLLDRERDVIHVAVLDRIGGK